MLALVRPCLWAWIFSNYLKMQRKWILIAGIVLMAIGVLGFVFKDKIRPSQAGIHIETTPQAIVYINNEEVGVTPYDGVREAGEVAIRLVPQSSEKALAPWSTKLTLTSGIKTAIKRDFGETETNSSGEVLSFEKISGSSAALTIVSSPDAAQVSVDGDIKGFTPLPIDTITDGNHTISVSQPGFNTREIQARAIAGYKLTIVALLSQDSNYAASVPEESTESAELETEDKKKIEVEIQDTPTGFLRVRKDSSSGSEEVAQVKPGEKFTLIEESKNKDWYKIEYIKGKEGWVSAQYAEKLED